MSVSLTAPAAVADRPPLAPAATLLTAALFGAVTLPLLVVVEMRPLTLAAGVLFACHGALTGVTAMAAAWLIYYRLLERRTWNPAAAALVAIAAGALWFLPLVPRSVDGHLFYVDPTSWLRAAAAARDPALLSLAAYFHCWPIACLAIWIGCCASGQARGWWRLRGWWPEWLAMWLLAIWSLPAVYVAWQIWWQYLRPDYLEMIYP
jgi:hypothetical protein